MSVPPYFEYRTSSPSATSSGVRLPVSSLILPSPTARTFPFCGFSFAVSGSTMPEAVVSSSSTALTISRSPRGLSFMRGTSTQIGPDLTDWHSKGESATREYSTSKAGSRPGAGAGRLPAQEPARRHLRSSRSLYRAIRRERTFYSHPAIVDVDHIIRHFPEHRKLALLADEPPP